MKLTNTIKILCAVCIVKLLCVEGIALLYTEESPSIIATQKISTIPLPLVTTVAFAQSPKPATQSTADKTSQEKQLQEKERILQAKEKELQALEYTVTKKLQEIEISQKKLEQLLIALRTEQDKKLRHLIDVYSNMKPQQAAMVLQTIEQPIAVQILSGMKGRKAGEILTFIEPQKAAKISEALTKLQIPLTK